MCPPPQRKEDEGEKEEGRMAKRESARNADWPAHTSIRRRRRGGTKTGEEEKREQGHEDDDGDDDGDDDDDDDDW